VSQTAVSLPTTSYFFTDRLTLPVSTYYANRFIGYVLDSAAVVQTNSRAKVFLERRNKKVRKQMQLKGKLLLKLQNSIKKTSQLFWHSLC